METYQINGITVRGEITWTRIGESVDVGSKYETFMVYGVDAVGIGYCAVGYMEDGVIDDIIDETLEIL